MDVGGANTNIGIWLFSGQLIVEQSQIRATGNGSVGVRTWGSSVIERSEIAGESNTIDGGIVFIGAGGLHGGPVSASATCAGVDDEAFTFYAGPACP